MKDPDAPVPSRRPNRRSFLQRWLQLAAGAYALRSIPLSAAAASTATTTTAPTENVENIATRRAFDRLDRAWNDGNGNAAQNNDAGALTWGESYALASYLLMYQTWRDRRYLDKLIDHADQVLKSRDTVRGVKDYRGLVLPAWSAAGKYTCGVIELKDGKGNPVLLVRSAVRPASQVTIAVSAGAKPGTFRLECTRKAPARVPAVDVFDNLTMDTVAARINGEFEKRNGAESGGGAMITAKDLRAPAASLDSFPAPLGPVHLAPLHYHYAVQTSMILQPLCGFARLIQETPDLKADARYASKADEYLHASQQAADLFDHEWRENPDAVEGRLIFARSSPSPFDGVDQPHNQYLALGSVYIDLASLVVDDAAKDRYRDRATKMARTFKNDLKLTPIHGYAWTYFWTKGRGYNGWSAADDVSDYQPTWVTGPGRGQKRIEDTSHAHIDIAFVLRAFDAKLGVFTPQDMHRFARTLTQQILTRQNDQPATAEFVDGAGRKGMYENMAAAWSPLNRFDASITPALTTLYASHPLSGNPQGQLFASALMNCAVAANAGV